MHFFVIFLEVCSYLLGCLVKLLPVRNKLNNTLLNISNKESYKAMHTFDLVHLELVAGNIVWMVGVYG